MRIHNTEIDRNLNIPNSMVSSSPPNSMRRALRSVSLITVALGTLILVGCNQQRASVLPAPSKVTMSVDTWIGYAPFYLAKEKGFFGDLDVEILVTTDVAQRKLMLATGKIDAIAQTVDQLVLDRSQGIPSTTVLGLDFSNGADGIIAVNSITSLNDLVGKTVLLQKNYASEALLNYLLQKNGIPFDAVTTIDTEAGAAGAAFVAGKTDAAVTFEPWLSKATQRKDGHVLLSSRDAPGVIVDILSVREQYLRDHPETVRALVQGWFKALQYWKEHTAESNEIMAKYYDVKPAEFAANVEGLIWPEGRENLAYFTPGNEPNIRDVTETFVQIFLKTGQIKSAPDLSTAIDSSILQSVVNAH